MTEGWRYRMDINMCFLGFLTCFVHLQVYVLGQVGSGMEMDVNKFFPHLLENSMHAINPMSVNNAGNDCLGSGNNIYGNIPMGNPMQTGFIANEQCPCQLQINSVGCFVCSCSTESPKTDNNIMTPNVPGLNIPFQFPNGPAHTSKQYTGNLSTKLPTNQKIQSSTTTVSVAPKGTQANVITYSTSLYKAIMKTNAEKTNFRSFVITPSFPLGDSYKEGYNKSIKDSGFPHEYTAVIVGLGTVLSIFLILVLIFVVKWRSTRRELRRQQSELYFVEKANRQSSLVSDIALELEREKRMSVYSEVSDDIEPPSPQADVILTPTAPPLTPGQKQQTAFRYPADDNRHDYLELI